MNRRTIRRGQPFQNESGPGGSGGDLPRDKCWRLRPTGLLNELAHISLCLYTKSRIPGSTMSHSGRARSGACNRRRWVLPRILPPDAVFWFRRDSRETSRRPPSLGPAWGQPLGSAMGAGQVGVGPRRRLRPDTVASRSARTENASETRMRRTLAHVVTRMAGPQERPQPGPSRREGNVRHPFLCESLSPGPTRPSVQC
jgi:hypothetical protein